MLINSSLNFSMGDYPACNINRNKSIWGSCGKGNQCQMVILEGDLEVEAIKSGEWGKEKQQKWCWEMEWGKARDQERLKVADGVVDLASGKFSG